jgi:phosphosulfolactate synthase
MGPADKRALIEAAARRFVVLAEIGSKDPQAEVSPGGDVRDAVADAVVDAVGVECVVFEAPRKEQQAWLIRRYGADVSLGNIAPAEALGLESLRLGLRADTFDAVPVHP